MSTEYRTQGDGSPCMIMSTLAKGQVTALSRKEAEAKKLTLRPRGEKILLAAIAKGNSAQKEREQREDDHLHSVSLYKRRLNFYN